MDLPKVFESEYRFCQILWEHEPIKSRGLVELCARRLGWKPTTTYTVIKRLSERGVIRNENTVVSSLVSREAVQAAEIDELLEKRFNGSLSGFLAAYSGHRALSRAELDALQRMIDALRERLPAENGPEAAAPEPGGRLEGPNENP